MFLSGYVQNILAISRHPLYQTGVKELHVTIKEMGCRMPFKMHFLCSHLKFFAKNLSAVTGKLDGRIYLDIKATEERFQ